MGQPSMRDYIDAMDKQAFDRLGRVTNDEILSRSVDEWIDDFIEKFATPDIPVIYPDQVFHSTVTGEVPQYAVPNPTYSSAPKVQGLIHQFHLPFTGNRNFFFYEGESWIEQFPKADVRADELLIAIGGAWYTPEVLEQPVDRQVDIIGKRLDRFRADAARYKQDLPGRLRARLEEKRVKAEGEAKTASGLKYPLKRREDAPQTYKLLSTPKPLAPKPVPAVRAEKEFTLDESDYQDILRICESMSLVMERSPTVFENAEEEHIRVHYLVQLNGQYQGKATGETFNNIGKTDILIRHENKNVFVAECKFWEGYEGLKKTVDQLLGYTTWRDTKTALIIFSRRQDFTSVITEAQRAMKDHQHFKSGPIKEGESRFRYTFTHPNDKQRDILVTLLLFDMPKPVKTCPSFS
jgi:hypothetical protein